MISLQNRLLRVTLTLVAAGAVYAWVTGLFDLPLTDQAVAPPRVVPASPGKSYSATDLAPPSAKSAMEASYDGPTIERLDGRIVDADGKGLAGIKVRLRTLRGNENRFILRQAVTDATGGFSLEDLDPRSMYMIYSEPLHGYPGYRRDAFTLADLPAPFEIRLSRLELVDVVGTVVDAEHAPIAHFTLTVDSVKTEYPSRNVTSDASGQFRLDAFPAGELKVYTAMPEYFRILGLRASAETYRNLTLVFDRGKYRLAGRVLDERGRPIAPARVTLSSTITGYEYRSQASRTSLTDASGGFEFTGLGGISHTLGVYASGYKPHLEYHEFQSFSDRLEIRLRR